MAEKSVREALHDTERRLAAAVRQRDQLNVAIVQLQSQVKALSKVLIADAITSRRKQIEDAAVGLTEMIRTVIRLTAQPMTAADIKNMLTVMGFDFSNFSNPSAAIHSTLKRMVSSGELIYMDAKGYRLSSAPY